MSPQKEIYPKNYLTQVICRVDFAEFPGLNNEPLELYEKIKATFPIKEGRVVSQFTTTINPSGAPATMVQTNDQIWDFFTTDKNLKFSLNKNFLVLELQKYTDFTNFAAFINLAITSFSSIYGSFNSTRFGLRYSNNIVLTEGNALVWGDNLNSSVTAAAQLPVNATDIRRFITQIVVKDDDEVTMNVVYGMANNPEFPARISRKEFLIDLDCYTEEPKSNTELISSTIQQFHDKIQAQFERLIGEGLRAKMRTK